MQNVVPALRMTNYEQAKRFYTEGLGFKIDWEHRFKPNFPVFMQVSRDGMILYLSEHRGDCQPGGLVHFFVEDVDAWYAELRTKLPKACAGLSKIVAPPSEGIPGLRDMTVLDPDGNKLRICARVQRRTQTEGYTTPSRDAPGPEKQAMAGTTLDTKSGAAPARTENIIPILRVQSVAVSIRYYVDVLGFRLDWGHPSGASSTFASVSRDGHAVMLSEGSQGNPGTWLWIGTDGDIDALCEEYAGRGARIFQRPTNYSWAYEMRVEDPDGHVLRFGSGPKRDQPFVD